MIVLIVGLSLIITIRVRTYSILDTAFFLMLWHAFLSCFQSKVLYPLLIHIFSSCACHIFGYVATTLCSPCFGLTIPSLIATPTSIALVLYSCFPQFDWFNEIICYTNGAGVWGGCALSAVAWLAPYLVKGLNLNKPSKILLKPFEELFIQPTWNSVFIDQHMSLNYKWNGFNLYPTTKKKKSKASRIFICTTMYREADFEMSRLLKSIYDISASKQLKYIYMESHIFLDNGVDDVHFTDFASQLLSLLETHIKVSPSSASTYKTPYGIQLHWILPSGMPFFIHMKDCSKVKAKKR